MSESNGSAPARRGTVARRALAAVLVVTCGSASADSLGTAALLEKPAGMTGSISSFASESSLLGTAAAPVVSTLYQSTVAFSGVSFTRLELQVPGAGLLDVQLSDLNFPTLAATLSFAVTDGTEVLGVINGTGSLLDFTVGGPSTLFAYVYGVAQPGFNLGAYTLDITHESIPAPVPLPPALLLFLSGLAATGWFGRRNVARRHVQV